jgi:uncharacterized membrane protein YkvI
VHKPMIELLNHLVCTFQTSTTVIAFTTHHSKPSEWSASQREYISYNEVPCSAMVQILQHHKHIITRNA